MPAVLKLSSRKVSEKKQHSQPETRRSLLNNSVLRVSRIPHELSEKELRQFFGQFGRIIKLRLSRSTKTGGSRGLAFLQYELPDIAKIATEATNNYFIAGRPIKVEHMNPEAVLSTIFSGANNKTVDPRRLMEKRSSKVRKTHNSRSHSTLGKSAIEKDAIRNAKLAESGIEYDFARNVAVRSERS